jgi:hypothetical protein
MVELAREMPQMSEFATRFAVHAYARCLDGRLRDLREWRRERPRRLLYVAFTQCWHKPRAYSQYIREMSSQDCPPAGCYVIRFSLILVGLHT